MLINKQVIAKRADAFLAPDFCMRTIFFSIDWLTYPFIQVIRSLVTIRYICYHSNKSIPLNHITYTSLLYFIEALKRFKKKISGSKPRLTFWHACHRFQRNLD